MRRPAVSQLQTVRMNGLFAITLALLAAVSTAEVDPFQTSTKGSELWNAMHYVVMEWVHGVNNKDLDRTMKLFSDHSWIQPPMHIGIEGYEDTADFLELLFDSKTVIKNTVVYEIGGDRTIGWARGSWEIDGSKSLFAFKMYPAGNGVWRTNILAWAVSPENPMPQFLAFLKQKEEQTHMALKKKQEKGKKQ